MCTLTRALRARLRGTHKLPFKGVASKGEELEEVLKEEELDDSSSAAELTRRLRGRLRGAQMRHFEEGATT